MLTLVLRDCSLKVLAAGTSACVHVYVYLNMHKCVYKCVHVCICVNLCMCECGSQRLISPSTFIYLSICHHLFFETGSLTEHRDATLAVDWSASSRDLTVPTFLALGLQEHIIVLFTWVLGI